MLDFLRSVQPDAGWIVLVGINHVTKFARQVFVQTWDEVPAKLAELGSLDPYFAVARYKTNESRLATNVLALQALWVDLDCGEEKAAKGTGYLTQADAIRAMKAFISKLKLPLPIIVNSGHGVHFYWPLTEAVTREEWEPVALTLKASLRAEGVIIDPSVFEAARVLRIPGTNNLKDPAEPAPVELWYAEVTPVSLNAFAELIGAATLVEEGAAPLPPGRGLSKMAEAIANAPPTPFTPSVFGEVLNHCAQMRYCVENRATLSEPLWRAALSIAYRTTEPEPAVDEVSRDYPDYELEDAMAKAALTKGPYTCGTFTSENPTGCEGCPHFGKIVSPIRLGEADFFAQASDRTQPLPDEKEIPEFPPGYFRLPNGGVIHRVITDDGPKETPIYNNDLYVVARLHEKHAGRETFTLRLHLPHDGVREETFEVSLLTKPEFKGALVNLGVMYNYEENYARIKTYIINFIVHLQNSGGATPVYEQFGWADDDTKFILGDQEISQAAVIYSPPSASTRKMARHLQAKGTLDKWKEVFAIYDTPALDGHALATLTGFGSPLLRFLGHNGSIINLISDESGTGKTTTLRLVNSIYGDPEKHNATAKDTANAMIHKLGIINNLPYTADELSTVSAHDISDLFYSMSQGQGKDRMAQSGNVLRENTTTWQTISLISSNPSLIEKIRSIKNNPDGELMRVLEFRMIRNTSHINKENKHLLEVVLKDNYGHAGLLYIQELLRNYDFIVNQTREIQNKLIDKLDVEQHERFWVGTIAANISGGLIARQLGLIGWNIERIQDWGTAKFLDMRAKRLTMISTPDEILGQFMTTYYNNILVLPAAPTPGMPRTMRAQTNVRTPIVGRIEPDTLRAFIGITAFKTYCMDNGITVEATVDGLQSMGIIVNRSLARKITAGAELDTTNIRCYELDYSHQMFSAHPKLQVVQTPNAVGT